MYLREAIDSIYLQSYSNWEIIFWDNASVDSSAEIAKSYDSKLRYFKVDETTVLGKARVSAVEKARGDYISFLDCDDIWHPDKLKKQVDVISSDNEVGFVYCRAEKISPRNSSIGYIPDKKMELPSGRIFKELVKQNFIPFVSVLVSLDKYHECGGFPKHYKNSTDYYLFLKLSYKYKVAAIDKVCCQYRVHAENMSMSHYVIGAKEDIEAVASFLPDEDAKEGLRYCYSTLFLMYVKEFDALGAIVTLMRHGSIKIILKRIIRKLNNLLPLK